MAEPSENKPAPGPDDLEIAPGRHLPREVVDFSFARSSGPGGQHVNRRATKVRMAVPLEALAAVIGDAPTRRLSRQQPHLVQDEQLVITCDEGRSQHGNRRICIERLRSMVVRALHRPKRRIRTKPTKASKQRRLDQKKQRGRLKQMRRPPRDRE